MITGQLFFREGSRAPDGRRTMMVIGVVALDDDDKLLEETQCVVVGEDVGASLYLRVFLPGDDLSKDMKVAAAKIGDLVLKPMWRV